MVSLSVGGKHRLTWLSYEHWFPNDDCTFLFFGVPTYLRLASSTSISDFLSFPEYLSVSSRETTWLFLQWVRGILMMYKKQNTLFFYIEGFDKLYASLSKHNVYFLNIISNKGEENSSSRKKSLRFDSGSSPFVHLCPNQLWEWEKLSISGH